MHWLAGDKNTSVHRSEILRTHFPPDFTQMVEALSSEWTELRLFATLTPAPQAAMAPKKRTASAVSDARCGIHIHVHAFCCALKRVTSMRSRCDHKELASESIFALNDSSQMAFGYCRQSRRLPKGSFRFSSVAEGKRTFRDGCRTRSRADPSEKAQLARLQDNGKPPKVRHRIRLLWCVSLAMISTL